MTDKEIICEFMEPRPTKSWWGDSLFDPDYPPCPWKWWYWEGLANIYGGAARPIFSFVNEREHLGLLHEVEARLTGTQRRVYMACLAGWANPEFILNPHCEGFRTPDVWDITHATAAQKVKALATVLRQCNQTSH